MTDSLDPAARSYADRSGPYQLPNDEAEHERLDKQATGLIALMNDKPFHASPSPSPKKILDVGCGTGAMTLLLGQKYPDAQVIGVDLSPVPASRHEQLPNVEFVQGDIRALVSAGQDERFQEGCFDYIYQRLLVFGMTEWPSYLGMLGRLLRPGGWVELQETSSAVYDAEGRSISAEWWFYRVFLEDMRAKGVEPEVGIDLTRLVSATGLFGHVGMQEYHIPPTARADRPELKGLGETVLSILRMVQRKIGTGKRSDEELNRLDQGWKSTWDEGFADTDHLSMFVVTAQRSS